MGRRRLFLLDGHSLSYRAFYALPTTLATATGQVTNAVYGFTSMLLKLLAEERPDLIAVAFDRGAPTVRLASYAEYKAGRPEAPDEFRQQLGLIEEVLSALAVPVVGVEGDEADDVIATLATRGAEAGIDVTIVTADRDFFQLVGPAITVMFNRKGISDIVRYDAAGVEERFGVGPDRYLDLVALKGDPSDNIPGVPGVGEKTAAKLVREFGSIETLLERVGEVKGKVGESIAASRDDLLRNKNLVRLVRDVPLEIGPEDCVIGERDADEIRRLFTSLEFRSLLDRVDGLSSGAASAAVEIEIRRADLATVAGMLAASSPLAVAVEEGEEAILGVAAASESGTGVHAPVTERAQLSALVGPTHGPRWTHDAKRLTRLVGEHGDRLAGLALDSMLAAYLLDPAAGSYALGEVCERHLGVDPFSALAGEALFAEGWREAATAAAAVAALAPRLMERLEEANLRRIHDEVELPLAGILADMERTGIAVDVGALTEMAEETRGRMDVLRARIVELAGEDFNLNSPQQLRAILYDKLGLVPGKKTPTGQPSTDASVLEKLRDRHPIVGSILDWRELDKLTSTYLDALPRAVDPRDGRIHTTFNQTGAATGRLSSQDPNLQNIPARSELGRRIRAAFVSRDEGHVLLCADYSQIELRILAHLSGDDGLAAAFAGDVDIHTETAARVFGVPTTAVDPTLRVRAKMINYGLAYGMNAFGLAQRLQIAPDEATEIMDAYFESFPQIAAYLDGQVARATADGYTETLLGRRRYIPELRSDNPRMRDLGRRMALNAPIQGTAADVFKLGMIQVARRLEGEAPDSRMLLTVHDELVFEVPSADVERVAGLVRAGMEGAAELAVPLRADVGWGRNWASAAPAGH